MGSLAWPLTEHHAKQPRRLHPGWSRHGRELPDPSGCIGKRRHQRFRLRWRHRWYHRPVEKTTLYLPEDLKLAVKRAAAERGVSEAEVIRESIRVAVGGVRPRPRGALYSSGQPIARDAEEMLAGFGER
jgi:hypothetical protein